MSEVVFSDSEVEPIVGSGGYSQVIVFDDSEAEVIVADRPAVASDAEPPLDSDATLRTLVEASDAVTAYQPTVAAAPEPAAASPSSPYEQTITFDPVHIVGRLPRSGPMPVEPTTGLTSVHRRLIDQPHIAADPIEPWTVTGVLRMKLEQATSDTATSTYLADYKDRWVRAHRRQIAEAAQRADVPAWVLGGVAWTEVGGDPAWADSLAEVIEDRERISYGPVQMELRRAEEELGYGVGETSRLQQSIIIGTLLDPQYNLQLVGRHLNRLKNIDAPAVPWSKLTDHQLRIAVSRYNRGPERTAYEMLHTAKKTSYGDAVLRRRARTERLLGED